MAHKKVAVDGRWDNRRRLGVHLLRKSVSGNTLYDMNETAQGTAHHSDF